MPRNQRIALILVALAAAVVAFVVLSPGGDDDGAGTKQAAETSTPAPAQSTPEAPAATAPATAPPAPKPAAAPLLTAAKPRTLTFSKGETIRFRVRHPAAEEVHVHGYDIAKDVPAGKTVTLRFEGDIEGIFEVELEHSGTPLGRLKVEP